MNNTEQTPKEGSAPAVARFTMPPDAARRFACDILALFPWEESELATDILPAFLSAALAGVKEYRTNKPLMLHLTGGPPAARADIFSAVRDMLADCPAVVCVPAGKNSADIAAAVRACPAARLLLLEDAAPVKSALRYIVQNAGEVAVLAFSQDTFADEDGGHHEGALELRLRDYIDDTEKNLLAEYRAAAALNIYRKEAARRASAALIQAENAEHGRADLTAAAVLDALNEARHIVADALAADAAAPDGIAAALAGVVNGETPARMQKIYGYMSGWCGAVIKPDKVLATLEACAPVAMKNTAHTLLSAYCRAIGARRREYNR